MHIPPPPPKYSKYLYTSITVVYLRLVLTPLIVSVYIFLFVACVRGLLLQTATRRASEKGALV